VCRCGALVARIGKPREKNEVAAVRGEADPHAQDQSTGILRNSPSTNNTSRTHHAFIKSFSRLCPATAILPTLLDFPEFGVRTPNRKR
jgi:hypothetical protein